MQPNLVNPPVDQASSSTPWANALFARQRVFFFLEGWHLQAPSQVARLLVSFMDEQVIFACLKKFPFLE